MIGLVVVLHYVCLQFFSTDGVAMRLPHIMSSPSNINLPQINNVTTEDGTIQLNVHDTLALTCVDNVQSLNWTLPKNSHYEGYRNPGTRRTVTLRTASGDKPYTYESALILTNLSTTDTGFYTCANIATGVSSQFYVYVQDGTNNILLKKHANLSGILQGFEMFRRNYLPCLVNRADATVTYSFQNILGGPKLNFPTNYSYVPKYGFNVPPNGVVAQEGLLVAVTCQATVTTEEGQLRTDSTQLKFVMLGTLPELKPPKINLPPAAEHAYAGLQSFSLNCTEFFAAQSAVGTCSWQFPNMKELNLTNRIQITISSTGTTFRSNLTFKTLQANDSGIYTCVCTDRGNGEPRKQSASVNLNVSNTHGQIKIIDWSRPEDNIIKAGGSVVLWVHYRIWPKPETNLSSVEWLLVSHDVTSRLPKSRQLQTQLRQAIFSQVVAGTSDEVKTFLELTDLTVQRSGTYSLVLTAAEVVEILNFTVHVTRSPAQQLIRTYVANQSDFQYLERNQYYWVACTSLGNYPLTSVTIKWKGCRQLETCTVFPLSGTEEFIVDIEVVEGTFERGLNLSTRATRTLTMYCGDDKGNNQITLEYIVTDIPRSVQQQGMAVALQSDSGEEIWQGDSVVLTCMTQKFAYSHQTWDVQFTNGSALFLGALVGPDDCQQGGPYEIKCPESQQLSTRINVSLNKTLPSQSGNYTCSADFMLLNGTITRYSRTLFLNIEPTYEPSFEVGTSPDTLVGNYSTQMSILCYVTGVPRPIIQWTKDGAPVKENLKAGVTLLNNRQELHFTRLVQEDAGVYVCLASNRVANRARSFELAVQGTPESKMSTTSTVLMAVFLGLTFLVMFALVVFVIILKRREKQRHALLLELYNQLMVSAVTRPVLNPALPINEQITNLPYDTRYEIPKERLDLGQQLGVGQFGKVFEGVYFSDKTKMSGRRVAVKVPRQGMKVDHQKALLTELKMMIYIGGHVNVLGLVGAVTKHMVKGELYVVMELCRLGALIDHLKKYRSGFYDELETIEPALMIPQPAKSQALDGYLLPNNSLSGEPITRYKSELNPQHNSLMDDMRLSGYFLATSDLLSYSYQVACGTEYLASRNLLHRDLAARNVLLTEENLVKICDFGLARKDETYQIKKSMDTPLPVKWMAIESIQFGEYTVKSDVWSFGILLWEIFSLGENPYPGLEVNEHFVQWLKCGNRMMQPQFSPDTVYNLMCNCWMVSPDNRPTFTECRLTLEQELKLCSEPVFDALYDRLTRVPGSSDNQVMENHDSDVPDDIPPEYRPLLSNYDSPQLVPSQTPEILMRNSSVIDSSTKVNVNDGYVMPQSGWKVDIELMDRNKGPGVAFSSATNNASTDGCDRLSVC